MKLTLSIHSSCKKSHQSNLLQKLTSLKKLAQVISNGRGFFEAESGISLSLFLSLSKIKSGVLKKVL